MTRRGAAASSVLLLAWLGPACAPPDAPPDRGSAAPRPRGETASLGRCAPIWWQPERGFADDATCTPSRDLAEIAARGGLVLVGSFWDVTEPRSPIPPARPCEAAATHASRRAFLDGIRALRSEGAPPLATVHLHRFELVPASFAALPGFDAGFLLHTRRPWSEVLGFFARDASPACEGGRCRWSDSFRGDPEEDHGVRLRDYIDRAGGEGAYRSVVYYLSWGAPGNRIFWPSAVLGDLRHPGYRAWRVAEAARALEGGGYDAILLNDKFEQYRRPGGHWAGSERAPDVAALNAAGTTLWSAPPDGYGYPEYVAGWAALGRDLRAAGVPYAVWTSDSPWRVPGFHDDPRTPATDEAELLRETARGARILVLTSPTTAQRVSQIEAELEPLGRIVLAGPARALCPEPTPAAAP